MIQCGQFTIEFDRNGFPLVGHVDWSFSISLLPVSKYQFERFLGESSTTAHGFTDSWYRSYLASNPRSSRRKWDNKPWELFLTGLKPEMTKSYLTYLGKGYRLPTLEERLMLYEAAPKLAAIKNIIVENIITGIKSPANLWLSELDLPLAECGLMELVIKNKDFVFVGKPWQDLLPNFWEPNIEREMYWGVHDQAIGFRVVKVR